jgi:hypothetical protein
MTNVKVGWMTGMPKSFIEILGRFRGAKATDLRDKVYSLLSLVDDHYRSGMVRDYSEHISAAEVFVNVANLATQTDDITRLLYDAGLHPANSTIGSLPSWVPDWTLLPNAPIDPAFYACAGSTITSVKPGASRNTLIVRGAIIDRPIFLGPLWEYLAETPLPDCPQATTPFLASFVVHGILNGYSHKFAEKKLSYPFGASFQDAIWQTLFGRP